MRRPINAAVGWQNRRKRNCVWLEWRSPSFPDPSSFTSSPYSLTSLLLFPSPPAPHRRSHSSWGTGNCVQAETPRLCWSEWPSSIPAPQRRKPNQGARFAFVIKYLPEVNWVARARLVLLFQFLGLNESGAALSRLCLTRCESGSESQMRIKAVKVFRTDAAGYYNASILNIASLIGTPYSV